MVFDEGKPAERTGSITSLMSEPFATALEMLFHIPNATFDCGRFN